MIQKISWLELRAVVPNSVPLDLLIVLRSKSRPMFRIRLSTITLLVVDHLKEDLVVNNHNLKISLSYNDKVPCNQELQHYDSYAL
jgi:hypothetical protein